MTIRCIAFDLDDTLWACKPVIERAEQRFYAWLENHYPRITERHTPAELIRKRINYMQQYPELHYNLTRLRKDWLAELADEHQYPPTLVEAGFEVFWLARNEVSFFDGALNVLQSLAGRYQLGVISNGNASVHHIGVGHLFQFAHSAAEAGVAKPHPEIFRQALAKVNILPEQAVYVGDDPVRDIQGAADAGWRTVWFNPGRMEWPGGQEPDAIIDDLAQLEAAITTL
ncbi:HAD family hydrolase [Thiothrix nivea]|uniref:HAD-superfamily hydrolase, subfamily IA, variant 3 n=1 Tax=Thiothrix nivea (strain ATCC 35100 / DSM 5205 / JP2) TaxID=870187 RepID=A0A656HDC5_THINJ|nr:HAD family hydrolase [Thiothrix nivea]EIJ35151.1 HAD-superfamily hydrolase, subfamily IA, variant 3 [Thiothrix nivea DSM 5205]